MRFHILVNKYTPSNTDYLSDAFNQLAIKFSNMMYRNGHEVYFYGTGSKITVLCTQYYCIIPDTIYENIEKEISCNSGHYLICTSNELRKKFLPYSPCLYYSSVVKLIKNNKQPNDIVCDFYGGYYSLEKYKLKDMFHMMPCQLGGFVGHKNIIYCCTPWKNAKIEKTKINR